MTVKTRVSIAFLSVYLKIFIRKRMFELVQRLTIGEGPQKYFVSLIVFHFYAIWYLDMQETMVTLNFKAFIFFCSSSSSFSSSSSSSYLLFFIFLLLFSIFFSFSILFFFVFFPSHSACFCLLFSVSVFCSLSSIFTLTSLPPLLARRMKLSHSHMA